MITLADYLLKHRTPVELARELAAAAKENAALKGRVGALELELFWMRAAERDFDAARLRRLVLFASLEGCVPEDDAALLGCLGSVLGQVLLALERRASRAA